MVSPVFKIAHYYVSLLLCLGWLLIGCNVEGWWPAGKSRRRTEAVRSVSRKWSSARVRPLSEQNRPAFCLLPHLFCVVELSTITIEPQINPSVILSNLEHLNLLRQRRTYGFHFSFKFERNLNSSREFLLLLQFIELCFSEIMFIWIRLRRRAI